MQQQLPKLVFRHSLKQLAWDHGLDGTNRHILANVRNAKPSPISHIATRLTCHFSVGMVSHWIGFLGLFGATIGLGIMSWNEKGPG
jgi:hypothetical protein